MESREAVHMELRAGPAKGMLATVPVSLIERVEVQPRS